MKSLQVRGRDIQEEKQKLNEWERDHCQLLGWGKSPEFTMAHEQIFRQGHPAAATCCTQSVLPLQGQKRENSCTLSQFPAIRSLWCFKISASSKNSSCCYKFSWSYIQTSSGLLLSESASAWICCKRLVEDATQDGGTEEVHQCNWYSWSRYFLLQIWNLVSDLAPNSKAWYMREVSNYSTVSMNRSQTLQHSWGRWKTVIVLR